MKINKETFIVSDTHLGHKNILNHFIKTFIRSRGSNFSHGQVLKVRDPS